MWVRGNNLSASSRSYSRDVNCQQKRPFRQREKKMAKKTIAFVVYPGVSLLELVGNHTLLSSIMGLGPRMKLKSGYESVVVGEYLEAISTDTPMSIIPQKTFADVPQPEGLVVIGGGADTLPALEHAELVEYVRRAGESAQWVASTSTGSLLLAAAGLLEGRLATTHWAYADRLEAYGARYQPYRPTGWVTDGKFTTAAGVSGASDMALGLGATMTNQAAAQSAQVGIEYDPQPPFGGIDYRHMKLLPRVIRGMSSLRAPFYTRKPRQLTRLGM